MADTWLGLAIGVVLYVAHRLFSPNEEVILTGVSPTGYPACRSKVLLPWL